MAGPGLARCGGAPGDLGVVYNGKGPEGLVLQGDAVVGDNETEARAGEGLRGRTVPTVHPIASEKGTPRRAEQAKKK